MGSTSPPDGALIVTEAFGGAVGEAAASSYSLGDPGKLAPVSGSVGDTRSEVCWAAVTNDGRFAYVTNFGDGTISSYEIADDGSLELRNAVAGSTRLGEKGIRDEAITPRRALSLRDRRRRPEGLRLDGRQRRRAASRSERSRASPRRSPGSPRADRTGPAALMRLEPLYRARFTTPERWSVEVRGPHGSEAQICSELLASLTIALAARVRSGSHEGD